MQSDQVVKRSASGGGHGRFATEWVLLLAVLLVLGGGLSDALWRSWRWRGQQERDRLAVQAQVLATNLERQFNAMNQALESLLQEQGRWRNSQEGMAFVNSQLQTFNKAIPSVLTLLILDADGTVIASSRADVLGRDFSHREYFRTTRQQGAPDVLYLGAPFLSARPALTMPLTRMLPDREGRFGGLLLATIRPDEIRILLDSVRYAPDMRALLIHRDGDLFMMQPELGVAGKNMADPQSFFTRHLQSGQEKSLFVGNVFTTGDARMVALQTVRSPSFRMDKPPVVVVSRSLREIYAPWRHNLLIQGGLFGLLAVGLSAGLWISQRQRRRAQAEKQRLDDRIRASNEEFERFFGLALDLLCIADLEGRFHKLNPAWEKVLGYPLTVLQEARFMDYVHPEDQEKTRLVMDELLHGRSVMGFVNRYRTVGGDYRFIEWHAVPAQGGLIYAAARDISDRVAVEQELRHSRERLTGIIEGTHVGTWEWQVQTGETVFNERWAEIIGYTLEELQPVSIETWMRFAHPDDIEESGRQLDACFRKEREYYECEARMRHRNGEWVWVLDRGKVVEWDDAGKPLLMLGTHQDVTERKKNEVMLIEARQAAEAASRAKSEFLANMSHEIRTPMNAVLGLTQLVLGSELQDEQREMLEMAHESGKDLLRILNDILDFSKVESGRLELEWRLFSLEAMLGNFSSLFASQLAVKHLSLQCHIAPEVPLLVVGDELRLSQVLGNLLGNAIKFTEKGGVGVRVDLVSLDQQGVRLLFTVRDTGIGLEREQIDRLFQAFVQADASITRKYGGTGLGLVISQRLVALMGGSISVSSIPGQGATFVFTAALGLPASDERLAKSTEPVSRKPDELKGMSILLVEDNEFNEALAVQFLRRHGALVAVAHHGGEAVDTVSRQRFDAVLMDLHMPEMDGYEATRQIRALPGGGDLPIIAMTAAVMPEDRQRCSEAGMNDFIAKPFEPAVVLDCLRRWVGHYAGKGNNVCGSHDAGECHD